MFYDCDEYCAASLLCFHLYNMYVCYMLIKDVIITIIIIITRKNLRGLVGQLVRELASNVEFGLYRMK
jgi:hypothetical protein